MRSSWTYEIKKEQEGAFLSHQKQLQSSASIILSEDGHLLS
jgi:hypothetical protein